MSQFYTSQNSGGGGGTVNSLTPDSGGAVIAVAGTIQTLGYKAGTVQTMRTYNDGAGNFRIADQTWQTQYVVDASTTDGLRGTFTTIQSAINQAVADGGINFKVIFIRPGTYIENLTIPSQIILKGASIPYIYSASLVTTIQGKHTISTGSMAYFQNLTFLNNGANEIFNVPNVSVNGVFLSCTFVSTTASAGIFSASTVAGQSFYSFLDCQVSKAVVYTGYDFQFDLTGGDVYIANTTFGTIPPGPTGGFATSIQITSGTIFIDNCSGIKSINTGSGSYMECYDSSFISYNSGTPAYFILGAGTGYLSDCDFGSNVAASSAFPTSGAAIQNTTGPWAISGLTSYGGIIYENGTIITEGQSTQGDVIQTKSTAVSYVASANDYYIGVTSTASARTITIPSPSVVTEGKVFYIKDESGGAGTRAITVTPASGTIDGAASLAINTNYGSLTVLKRGSNYFAI